MKNHSKSKLFITLLSSFILVSGAIVPNFQALAHAQGAPSSEKLRKTLWTDDRNTAEPIIEVPEGLASEPIALPNSDRTTPKADSIIVKIKNGANSVSLAKTYGLESAQPLPGTGTELLKLPEGADIDAILSKLASDPSVVFAEPNNQVLTSNLTPPVSQGLETSSSEAESVPSDSEDSFPNDPLFPQQWGLQNTLDNTGDFPSVANVDIDAPEAWSVMKDNSKEVVVAVISDGVDINHPDLADNIWTNPKEIADNGIDDDGNGFVDDVHGWDFFNDDNNTNDNNDLPYQGTAMTGIIAASINNSIGIAGIAPNAKILPIKTFSYTYRGGSFAQIASGIAYAEQMGADIAVLDFASWEPSELIYDLLKDSNMLFVAPSGDMIENRDQTPMYPASYDLPNLLTVMGTIRDGALYSAFGKNSVDIAAPAAEVLSTTPSDNFAFAAQIDTGTYKAIFNGLGYEWFNSSYQTDSAKAALDYLAEGIDNPSILLVQDDNSLNATDPSEIDFKGLYQGLLLSAGYDLDANWIPDDEQQGTFQVVTVPKGESGPSLETMEQYDIVVWFTGNAIGGGSNVVPVLSESDKASLTDYMNAGGRLLLSGKEALSGNEKSSFVTDMLHLEYLHTGLGATGFNNNMLLGVDGTIYAGQEIPMPEIYDGEVIAAIDSYAQTNLLLDNPDYDLIFAPSSEATAHAAGVAALILGQNPKYDPKMVIQRLMNSGKKISSLVNMNMSGSMVDAYRALSDKDIPGTPLQDLEVSDYLDETTDPDRVYAIDLHAGETIKAKLTGDEGTDFDLYLYDPTATTIGGKTGIVASSETKNTSTEQLSYLVTEAGTYYLNVYAFGGSGNFTLGLQDGNPLGTYEEDSNAVYFTGDWKSIDDSDLSGGHLKRLDGPGTVEFTLDDNYIEWIGTKNAEQGIANVYIDGDFVTSVSLYSATELKQQTLFKKVLGNRKHTIKIEWTGNTDPKDRTKTSAFVNVDAFVVKHLVQDSDFYKVLYDGAWLTNFSSLYLGQSATTSIAKDSYCELTFVGKKVRLYAPRGVNRGIADIYIDGKLVDSVDLYSPTRQYQTVSFESELLSEGTHTIRIVNSGKKNVDSTSTAISIDAFHIE
ncbi:S8 family serine peptidase [Cohnella sp. AR92]|uniref:S8 family serine peptidase n=1 Tax=Cohnella sp. AR92 TaxID=648716 RepID=UPI000F8CA28F|nr:S8 family serine peptidase [Cohnella sp. AR92]RUS45673.1 hypothetical protein ELR57_17560 [Cohnella sp. AR92]